MNITIPAAALDAARLAYHDLSKADPIEAACLAMLAAWPGMEMWTDNKPDRLILPLAEQEAGDE
jgi:hypothetical protein